jgi:hypothetical protein
VGDIVGRRNVLEEKWAEIEGTKYLVSNLGEIVNGNTNHALKLVMDGRGNLKVALSTGGVKKYHVVHRLVARAFLADFDDDYEVKHIDTNNSDCSVGNLKMGEFKVGKRRGI